MSAGDPGARGTVSGGSQPAPAPEAGSPLRARRPAASPTPGHADDELLAALRRGDESAFTRLVELHHASMVRVARAYVASPGAAEDVAQEAWLGVLQGLERFQARCTLKAWIFAIVVNCAKTRGARDRRTVPLSALGPEDGEGGSVEPERFLDEGHPRWPGHWATPPRPWEQDDLVARETLEAVATALEQLPPMQRAVMTMRDVEGLGSDETCQVLALSEANQRVLLHRARSKVRRALEGYLGEGNAS